MHASDLGRRQRSKLERAAECGQENLELARQRWLVVGAGPEHELTDQLDQLDQQIAELDRTRHFLDPGRDAIQRRLATLDGQMATLQQHDIPEPTSRRREPPTLGLSL